MNNGYCRHGKYVGGIGIDWICGLCEIGANTYKEFPVWHVFIANNDGGTSETLKAFTWEHALEHADYWLDLNISHLLAVTIVEDTEGGWWIDEPEDK